MGYSVHVNSGVVLALSQVLSPVFSKDILDTIAFAKLAADEDFPDGLHDSHWFDTFSDTLSGCGWSLFAQRERDTAPTLTEGTLSVIDTLVTLAESGLRDGQAKLISSVLGHVLTLSEEKLLTRRLRTDGLAEGAGMKRFRAMTGIVNDGGFLSMVAVSFNTQGSVDQYYFDDEAARKKPDGNVTSRVFAARFNQGQYDEFRADVLEWLTDEPQALYIEMGQLPPEKGKPDALKKACGADCHGTR